MNSRIFADVNVYKKRPVSEAVTECTSHVSEIRLHEVDVIDFISKLDIMPISGAYDKISHYLGSINPNKIVPYVDKLVRFRIHDYVRNMLPFLTEHNIIRMKNIINASNASEQVRCEISDIIEEEMQIRCSRNYTKILFFSECGTIKASDPFDNIVIKDLYSSMYKFDPSCECCVDCDDISSFIENFSAHEHTVCRDNIYTFFMALTGSVMTQAEHIRRGGDVQPVTEYAKIITAIQNHMIYQWNDSAFRVMSNTVDICIEKIKRVEARFPRECECAQFLRGFKEELQRVIENVPSVLRENMAIACHELSEMNDDDDALLQLENDFSDAMLNLIMDDNSPEVELEQIDDMIKLSYIYESKLADTVVRGSAVAKKGTQKAANVVKHAAKDVKKMHRAVTDIPSPFTNLVKNTYEKIKKMDKDGRRKAIVTGGLKGRLIRLLRLGIKLMVSKGIWSILGPVYGTIGILAQFALDGKLDYKTKAEILKELETELKIVKEKLDDARGDNDKKAKYELMRLQEKLEDEIKRIRLSI